MKFQLIKDKRCVSEEIQKNIRVATESNWRNVGNISYFPRPLVCVGSEGEGPQR